MPAIGEILSPTQIGQDPPQDGVSSDVLRGLHADNLRQLRSRAMFWAVVLAAAAAIWGWSGFGRGVMLFVGLIAWRAGRTSSDWFRARRVDPVAAACKSAVEARVEERRHLQAFNLELATKSAVATSFLAALIVAVGVIEWMTAGTTARTVARAGLIKPMVSQGEWWRLVTATFVHANIGHLLMNLGALMSFGRIAEGRAPRPLLLITYVVSGIAGSLASWFFFPHTSSLGASGAIMGVIAFVAVLGWRRPGDLPAPIRQQAAMTLVLTGYLGALLFGLIDNAAHAGGAVAGALIAVTVIPGSGTWQISNSPRWLATAGVVAAIALVVGAGGTAFALAGGPAAITAHWPGGRNITVPVTSVTAALERDAAGLGVVIQNRSDKVLEAYEVVVEYAAARTGIWRDDCCFDSTGSHPVPPGATMRVVLGESRWIGAKARATIAVVVFADGSFEGSSQARDVVMRRRREVMAETQYWIGVVQDVSAVPPAVAAVMLERDRQARSAYGDASDVALKAFGIPGLTSVALNEPARFIEEAARTREAIARTQSALADRLGASSAIR